MAESNLRPFSMLFCIRSCRCDIKNYQPNEKANALASASDKSEMSNILSPDAFKKHPQTHILVIVYVLLACLTSAIYLQVINHDFINFDDDIYITSNKYVTGGITAENLGWSLTSIYAANWHPITWLSHMADVQLYGMNPGGHHLTNIIIHLISTLLLLIFFFRLTGAIWQSAFVAAIFALHPTHVESVAWVAERKDLLSALFYFSTLLIYAEFATKRTPILYFLALFSFMLGLMSKPMLVSLPFVMLLIDFWPLDRFGDERLKDKQISFVAKLILLVKEKIPFFACALISGIITIYAQNQWGAINTLYEAPLGLRLSNAIVAYVKYIGKALWPHDLSVYYPLPTYIPTWHIIGSLVILLLLSAISFKSRHRYPFLLTGWFWFLVTLVPVIGLIQVGSQSIADRYTYISMIGLSIMIAWGISCLMEGLRYRRLILCSLTGMAVIGSAALTYRQLSYWQDSISLYRHAIQVTDGATGGSTFIHANLGLALYDKGDLDGAIQEYEEALSIYPNYANALNNLGLALYGKGDIDGAIQSYEEALLVNPNHVNAHNNLGIALADTGNMEKAIQEYQKALSIDMNNANAHFNLAHALELKGEIDMAIAEYEKGLQIDPNNEMANRNLNFALDRQKAIVGR